MRLIFSHIPKAAGTSVFSHLESGLKIGSKFKFADNSSSCIPISEWPDFALPRDWLLIGGHMKADRLLQNSSISVKDDQICFFSVLRDPIDRMISIYNYVRTTPKHYSYEKMKKINLTDFLLGQPSNYLTEWLQIPKEAAWKILLTDVSNIMKAYSVIADSCSFINRDNLLSTPLPIYNSTPLWCGSAYRNEIPAKLLETLYIKNYKDYALLSSIYLNGGTISCSVGEMESLFRW